MSAPGDVPPSTVGVELLDHGVEVEYIDGRTALYRGVPQKVTDTLTTPPGKETHVLVTNPDETQGVMMYVNDRNTDDEILESSGVGRIILDTGESEELFPGVRVARTDSYRNELSVDLDVARGRVFCFVEDERGEASYEFVAEE
jgi:hypothetical protein